MIIKSPNQEDISQLRRLWQEAFGDTDAFLDSFFSTAFSFDRCLCVLEDGVVAAALYWFSCQADGQPFAYIYAVATAEAYRGRGICRQLMAHTHTHLKDSGYAGAILVPGDKPLREMYRAMGYRDMTTVERFSCQAGVPMSLEQIDAAEYATLRRERLPQNAVLQEGANLCFLETMAQFYRSEDAIFCAAKEDDRLIVPELLGSTASAPGIVAALGCKEGVFTVPGKKEPFAMGISFVSKFREPQYFAFAFN